MPNWCENQLVIEGPKEDLEDIISHSFMFEQYFPTPLFHSEIFDKNIDEDVKSDLLEKAVDGDWYTWRNEHWGVKWDCGLSNYESNNYDIYYGEDSKCIVNYYFQSPWGPPVQGYEKLSVLYPLSKFKLFFIEEGMSFLGYYIFFQLQLEKVRFIYYESYVELKKIVQEDYEFDNFEAIEGIIESLEEMQGYDSIENS